MQLNLLKREDTGWLLTDETRHHTTNSRGDTEEMSDRRSIQEFILEDAYAWRG
jgi:hypothetical protein